MQVGKTLDGAPVGLILPKLNTSAGMEAIKDIPPQRLVELAQAERDGRLVVSRFKHGDCVWAIERDEYGEALDVAGSMFLAEVLGVVIAIYVEPIRQFFQHVTGRDLFPSELYYLSELPSKLVASQVIGIALIAVLLAFLATLYPAWKAANTDPVDVLRNE